MNAKSNQSTGAAAGLNLAGRPEGHRFYAELAWPVLQRELRRLE